MWQDYKRFFKYSVGGIYGIVAVITIHLVMHLSTVAVSIYLGLTLTNILSDHNDKNFLIILGSLIVVAIVSSSLGKLISTKIFLMMSQRLHDKMMESVVHTDIKFFE